MNKFIVDKRNTIWELKNKELKVSIHKFFGLEDDLFLTCYALDIKAMSLHTNDFDEAVSKAKQIIKDKVEKLYSSACNFINDDEYEIERW